MSQTRAELARFALAGVAGLVADVAVLYLALGAGLGYYAGRVLSFLAAVWVTWRINRRYTFTAGHAASTPSPAATHPASTAAGKVAGNLAGKGADGGTWAEWWRYLSAMLGGGLVNYLAYSAVVALLPPHPLLPLAAVAAGSLAGMAINFVGAKYSVFNRSS